MITFKSTEDLTKLPPEDPAYPTIEELVDRLITAYTLPGQPYNHEDYGYVILIQEGDVDRDLDEIWEGCRLIDIPWEGIMLRDVFSSPSTWPTTSTAWCSSSRTHRG